MVLTKEDKISNRSETPLVSWVLNRFGGTDARQAISDQAEKLVQSTGISLPPVCLVKLAKVIGVDPWPVYETVTEGALKVINGKMRIVLRRNNLPRQTPNAMIGRSRFTYAHELGHALFYDLKSCPPARLAPIGFHRIEEQLCNKAAAHFLIPDFLLLNEISNVSQLSLEIFRELAQKFQTSIQSLAYRLAESFSDRLKSNQFYMLSAKCTGFRGTGLEKPRCVISILGPGLTSQNITFLRSYQGIDHVKRRVEHRRLDWSLEEYFQRGMNQKCGSKVESEEVVECPSGLLLELKVHHRTMDRIGLVWSEGTVEILEMRKSGGIKKPLPTGQKRL